MGRNCPSPGSMGTNCVCMILLILQGKDAWKMLWVLELWEGGQEGRVVDNGSLSSGFQEREARDGRSLGRLLQQLRVGEEDGTMGSSTAFQSG